MILSPLGSFALAWAIVPIQMSDQHQSLGRESRTHYYIDQGSFASAAAGTMTGKIEGSVAVSAGSTEQAAAGQMAAPPGIDLEIIEPRGTPLLWHPEGATAESLDDSLGLTHRYRPVVAGESRSPRAVSMAPLLSGKIANEFSKTRIDEDCKKSAQGALRDACAFVDLYLPRAMPAVMISSEGVIMLQWRRGERGVVLLFLGDGVATYAVKGGGEFYAANGIEFSPEHGVPPAVVLALVRLALG